MRTLVIPVVLVLIMGIWAVAATAGENSGSGPSPTVSQQVNDTQLDGCKGRLGNPADLSQVSRTVPNTEQVVGDTVNFSKDVIATMKGYNTHPPDDPSIGTQGSPGPSQNIGPTWARGQDITMHNR